MQDFALTAPLRLADFLSDWQRSTDEFRCAVAHVPGVWERFVIQLLVMPVPGAVYAGELLLPEVSCFDCRGRRRSDLVTIPTVIVLHCQLLGDGWTTVFPAMKPLRARAVAVVEKYFPGFWLEEGPRSPERRRWLVGDLIHVESRRAECFC